MNRVLLIHIAVALFITVVIKSPTRSALADKVSLTPGRRVSLPTNRLIGLYREFHIGRNIPGFKPVDGVSETTQGPSGGGGGGEEGEHLPDLATLKEVIEACRRALRYFRGHVAQMNFDAVIGTRIAEAQFKMVLEALEKRTYHQDASKEDALGEMGEMVGALRSLHQEARDLNTIAEPFIKDAFPEYYRESGAILKSGFWEVPLSMKILQTPANPLPNPNNVLSGVEQIRESQSDKCVSEACKAIRKDTNDFDKEEITFGKEQCSLSGECWDLMTKPGYSGYSLTHQVFYLVIGLQAGCGGEEERFAHATLRNNTRMTVSTLLEQMCFSILVEANTIAQAGFPEERRDLFMEQGALCGLVGYRDFFRKQWLAKVLSWQRSLGCFGDALLYSAAHKVPEGGILPAMLHSRVKREESPMAGRCLAHRTTVAVGYLSLYVRYLALALFK